MWAGILLWLVAGLGAFLTFHFLRRRFEDGCSP